MRARLDHLHPKDQPITFLVIVLRYRFCIRFVTNLVSTSHTKAKIVYGHERQATEIVYASLTSKFFLDEYIQQSRFYFKGAPIDQLRESRVIYKRSVVQFSVCTEFFLFPRIIHHHKGA